MHAAQVVKLKDEYITDLESKGPKLELPPAQSNLNEALQCAVCLRYH